MGRNRINGGVSILVDCKGTDLMFSMLNEMDIIGCFTDNSNNILIFNVLI